MIAEDPVHTLVSPEGVQIDLPVAGPAPRIFAYAVDGALSLVILVILGLTLFFALPLTDFVEPLREALAGLAPEEDAEGEASFALLAALLTLWILAQFLVETGYFIFWEMMTNGRSPGKALLGLCVVRRGGLPVDLQSSVVRNLLRIADVLPANYVVGLVSMIVSSEGQRLGDHAAGTIVIRLDAVPEAPAIAIAPDVEPLALTRDQLARLGDDEVRLLRGTLRRLGKTDPGRRRELASEIADVFCRRLEIPGPPPDPERFLAALCLSIERGRTAPAR